MCRWVDVITSLLHHLRCEGMPVIIFVEKFNWHYLLLWRGNNLGEYLPQSKVVWDGLNGHRRPTRKVEESLCPNNFDSRGDWEEAISKGPFRRVVTVEYIAFIIF